jgi:hypothetical protein
LITGAHGDPAVKVTGMGGIGKSLLAREYALRFAAGYPCGVSWLARTATTTLARRSQARPPTRSAIGNCSGSRLPSSSTQRDLAPSMCLERLPVSFDARGDRFLWVVDDPPGGLDSAQLEQWLSPGRFGRTLLTTRSHDYDALGAQSSYDAIGAQIDLGVLSAEAGLELLTAHRAPVGLEDDQAARGLVEDLGRHALTLDVAGAALRAERGVRSYAAYRSGLPDLSADELELTTEFAGERPGGHETSITTTLARIITQPDNAGLDFLRWLRALLSSRSRPNSSSMSSRWLTSSNEKPRGTPRPRRALPAIAAARGCAPTPPRATPRRARGAASR